MDVIRRNTDYALRALVYLAAARGDGPVSARRIAREQGIGYALTCKLLQRLQEAGMVRGRRGAGGGFTLARAPAAIVLRAVVEAIQGSVTMSSCVPDPATCARSGTCGIRGALVRLQRELDAGLGSLTLADFAAGEKKPPSPRRSRSGGKAAHRSKPVVRRTTTA